MISKELPEAGNDLDALYDNDEPEIFGYFCMCCQHIQEVDDDCDRCGACCMEPMYE